MSSRFFIERPIFASVLAIVIVVVGLVSLAALPIAQFPEITPPVVQIDADYPGASAEIVADAVARPIEVQLPGIDNLLYYDSTSSNDGHMTIRLTFEIGTNVDIAQVQTQNREKLAEPRLPPEVVRQGVSIIKQSPDLLAVLTLESSDPRHDTLFLANYAILQIVDNLKRLPGVGDASVFGAQSYSMRLVLDPVRMAQLNLTPTDIANVVREQNRDFPAGTIGREPAPKGTQLTIPFITRGRLTDVKDFEELIVRALPDGSIIRLKDVAKIELGAQSYDLEGRFKGKPTTFLLTFLSPGANALDTADHIKTRMRELETIRSFLTGQGLWIHAKALLAQYLLEKAFADEGRELTDKAVGEVAATFHYRDMNEHPGLRGISPSAEVVARYFFDEVRKGLGPEGRLLRRVRVWEAPGCSAAYAE